MTDFIKNYLGLTTLNRNMFMKLLNVNKIKFFFKLYALRRVYLIIINNNHRFPKEQSRSDEWIKAIGCNMRSDFDKSKHGICSRHFDLNHFDGNRLRFKSIPIYFDDIENLSRNVMKYYTY